jgi:superfamily II RNA helicase
MRGKAQLLESKFRITYKMILSLLRKRDMRIQDFMRRSFSEHKMTAAEDPAVYEAASGYLVDKLDVFRVKCRKEAAAASTLACAVCGQERMLSYYAACADYSDLGDELYERLKVHGGVFKTLQPGRVVFVKSTHKLADGSGDSGATTHVYKLAPVVLLEAFNKDTGLVLALSLDEVDTAEDSNQDELWEDEDSMAAKMNSFYTERLNSHFEQLVEKLKTFRVNDVQVPFVKSSLATYLNLKCATLVQIKYGDIKAIGSKVFVKNPQLHFDFSFTPVWREITTVHSGTLLKRNKNTIQ